MDTLDKLYEKGVSRRDFMVGAGAASAVMALAGCNNATAPTTPAAALVLNDTDILTFALNLEYLEAEFYLYAATGQGLTAADAGTGAGTTIVPATTKLTGLTTAQQNFVNELAYTEQSHVRYLRAALGSTVIARPVIDLTFFATLAMVATITTTATFSPFTSYDNFLIGGFIFEDVGVTAYNGAAPLISAAGVAAGYLAAAAGIMAVEAYHSAAIRTQITANAIAAETIAPSTTNAAGAVVPGATTTTYAQFNYANLVAKLRSTLGGGGEVAVSTTANPANTAGFGLTLPNSLAAPFATTATTPLVPSFLSSIVNANTSALAFARTPDQVLHIAYGNVTPGTAKGGFFPNGANYRFAQTTS